jgi:hypothetical protein
VEARVGVVSILGQDRKYEAGAADLDRPFRRVSTRQLCRLVSYGQEIGLCDETVDAARAELKIRRRLAARRWGRW